MRTVWKFQVPVTDAYDLTGPKPLRIIHVAPDGPAGLFVWAEVDTDRPDKSRSLRIVGTGNPIPDELLVHHASVEAQPFVWHIYEALG